MFKHIKGELPIRNEIESMTIICNIQMMQDKIYGSHIEHFWFNGNTIDELRNLQDELIKEYNKSKVRASRLSFPKNRPFHGKHVNCQPLFLT